MSVVNCRIARLLQCVDDSSCGVVYVFVLRCGPVRFETDRGMLEKLGRQNDSDEEFRVGETGSSFCVCQCSSVAYMSNNGVEDMQLRWDTSLAGYAIRPPYLT